MPKEIIVSNNAPKAIGAYSQAVKAGKFVFFSGQIALDPETGIKVPGGIETQTKRIMENLKALAADAGGSLENIIKTTVYLKNLDDFKFFNREYEKYFNGNYPARSTVGVSDLPRGVEIEIDAIMTLE